MLDEDYWRSPAGLSHQHRGRRDRGVLAWAAQEPEKKGPRGARSALDFRRQIREGLAGHRVAPWPRADLALELDFVTTRKQPANIEKLAKHHLDLLGATHAPLADPGAVLYRDDKQVKMLFVSCHHDWDPRKPVSRPRILVRCQPRTDAVAEMEASFQVAVHHDEPEEEGDVDIANNHGLHDQLRHFEASDDPDSRRIAADIRFQILQDRQMQFLRASDRWLTHTFRSRGRELITGNRPAWEPKWQDLADQFRAPFAIRSRQRQETPTIREGIDAFFQVPLPSLPTGPRERAGFEEKLHTACRQFLDRHPWLSPLVVPLRVTILVVPPGDKDLDNIALSVVPVINQHFRPHQEPWLLDGTYVGLPPGLRHREHDEQRSRDLARLRSLVEYSVWAYQVIELCCHPDDPPEGWMAVVLGHGENRRSLWCDAEDYVERFLERMD